MDQVEVQNEPVISDISGDGQPDITEIESLCLNCENQGMTRLLLTRIPHFREVIISSFQCNHCGNSNRELQPAARLQDKAVKLTVHIDTVKDLSRHVVITDTATVNIPELEFEIPPGKGNLTTVEGIIQKAVDDLEQDQEFRKVQDVDVAEKISVFIERLKRLKDGVDHFTIIIDDISGNSLIENLLAPADDPQLSAIRYTRTKQQDEKLCIYETEESTDGQDHNEEGWQNEVLHIDSNCSQCNAPCPVNMKLVAIPHFKEVVIMAMTCDVCGYRGNEVKGGAGVSEKGRRITVCIEGEDDLKRDLLKSDTSSIQIPELEIETSHGTLGGKFTTVEGLLVNIKDNLKVLNPFVYGDSGEEVQRQRLEECCERLRQVIEGERLGVHLVLDDPAGNSFIENLFAPEPDPQMQVEDYERTFEQNEELGLNDMNTENYLTP